MPCGVSLFSNAVVCHCLKSEFPFWVHGYEPVYPQLPPLLALPITVGTAKYPGIKIHDTRMIRLMEVLLAGGPDLGDVNPPQMGVSRVSPLRPGIAGTPPSRKSLPTNVRFKR
jgi:hypothetical protein